jgi:hypothetical protein
VTEEVIRLLPEGIACIPVFLNIRRGTEDEFKTMMPLRENDRAARRSQLRLDPSARAPPFMVQGRKREAQIVKAWEKKYKVPIFTVAQNHVAALQRSRPSQSSVRPVPGEAQRHLCRTCAAPASM